MIAATLEPKTAAETEWEFLVIGAGPAGAFAALRLAQAGRRVLLLEKRSFPREKVCGGCLGGDAVALLNAAGLQAELEAAPQGCADRLRLHASGRSAALPIRTMRVIARSDLDALIVTAAIRAGAHFLPETTAAIGNAEARGRAFHARTNSGFSFAGTAKTILAADGLAHSSLRGIDSLQNRVARGSYIGLGSIVEEDAAWCEQADLPRNTIQMVVGRGGYVGLARSRPDRLHIAAAVRPQLAANASPAEVVAGLLQSSGRRAWIERARTHWSAAAWSGTPPLTRRFEKPAADGVFAIGDSAGYVEPFLGEGMSRAMLAAERLVALLVEHHASPVEIPSRWRSLLSADQRHRSGRCFAICRALRVPGLAALAVRVLSWQPSLASLAANALNRPLAADGVFSS